MIPASTAAFEPLERAESELIAAGWRRIQGCSMTMWSHAAYRFAIFSTVEALRANVRIAVSPLPANAPTSPTIAGYARGTQPRNSFTAIGAAE